MPENLWALERIIFLSVNLDILNKMFLTSFMSGRSSSRWGILWLYHPHLSFSVGNTENPDRENERMTAWVPNPDPCAASSGIPITGSESSRFSSVSRVTRKGSAIRPGPERFLSRAGYWSTLGISESNFWARGFRRKKLKVRRSEKWGGG